MGTPEEGGRTIDTGMFYVCVVVGRATSFPSFSTPLCRTLDSRHPLRYETLNNNYFDVDEIKCEKVPVVSKNKKSRVKLKKVEWKKGLLV